MKELTTAPVVPVAVSPIFMKPAAEQVSTPKEEVIESKDDDDIENGEQDATVAATFIKKPSKPKPKPSDLWRKAGMNIRSKLNLPANKGLLGVVTQAEAQGKIKPKMFNRNITKAISAMAKKQAAKDQVKDEKISDQKNKKTAQEIDQKVATVTENTVQQLEQDIKPEEMDANKEITENKAKKIDTKEEEKKPVPPKLFPKPAKGTVTVKPVLKKSESTDSKSSSKTKNSLPDKPKTKKKAPVTRPRSASVTTKPSATSPAVKDTKPRRQSVAGM